MGFAHSGISSRKRNLTMKDNAGSSTSSKIGSSAGAAANILSAIEAGDQAQFLRLLDEGVREATRVASAESHSLGLRVADGRVEPYTAKDLPY